MAKKHVRHKWTGMNADGVWCECPAGANATLSRERVLRILNSWERRPKYVKLRGDELRSTCESSIAGLATSPLYVKVSR